MNIRTLILAATTTLALGACGKSKIDKMISAESDWKDKVCACSDKDCADKTWKGYKSWDKDSKNDVTEDDIKNISGDQMEKAMKVEEELQNCHHKFDK